MANTENPLMNYNFLLRVEGIHDMPCKQVHGFSKEYEYEYIREGGVNDYVHLRRKPVSRPNILRIERYADGNILTGTLLKAGAVLKLPLLLSVSSYPGEFSKPKRLYTFTGCVVTKVEYGELSAAEGRLLTETIFIAYETVLCVDNPVSDEKSAWQFDGTKPEGKGQRYARKLEDYGIDTAKEPEGRKWPAVSSHQDITKYLGR